MSKSDRPEPISTPRGEVVGFCAVQTPTYKYKSETEKEYQIRIALNPEDPEVAAWIDEMHRLRDVLVEETKKANPKVKNLLKVKEVGKPETDENGNLTGRVVVKLTQNHIIPGKKGPIEKHVGLFDSRRQAIKGKVPIGAGSIVRCSFNPNPYFKAADNEIGMSFNRLVAVKLLKLVPYEGGMSAAKAGFGDEDEDADFGDDAFDASSFVAGEGAGAEEQQQQQQGTTSSASEADF